MTKSCVLLRRASVIKAHVVRSEDAEAMVAVGELGIQMTLNVGTLWHARTSAVRVPDGESEGGSYRCKAVAWYVRSM